MALFMMGVLIGASLATIAMGVCAAAGQSERCEECVWRRQGGGSE